MNPYIHRRCSELAQQDNKLVQQLINHIHEATRDRQLREETCDGVNENTFIDAVSFNVRTYPLAKLYCQKCISYFVSSPHFKLASLFFMFLSLFPSIFFLLPLMQFLLVFCFLFLVFWQLFIFFSILFSQHVILTITSSKILYNL